MKNLFLVLSLTLLTITDSQACYENQKSLLFLPKNKMNLPVGLKSAGGLSKEQFDGVLNKIQILFEQKATQEGFRFKIKRLWNDGQVNASAMPSGELTFYGGLARHPSVTADSFALVVCHEVGHLIGGFPKYPGPRSKLSAESQSDYFGALKCLRQVFNNDDNAAIVAKQNAPKLLIQKCTSAHGRDPDLSICIRSAMAGLDLGVLLNAVVKDASEPAIDRHDPLVITKTLTSYPSNQCRLDTFIQGALCEENLSEDLSQLEEVQGACHKRNGHQTGMRPACWFKAKI